MLSRRDSYQSRDTSKTTSKTLGHGYPLTFRTSGTSGNSPLSTSNLFLRAAKDSGSGCVPTRELRFKEIAHQLPTYTPSRRKIGERAIRNQFQGQGSATRGWGALFPRKGHERAEVREKCGPQCFLSPENNGFPICAALRMAGTPDAPLKEEEEEMCLPMTQGIEAAYHRARQYHHDEIADLARRLRDTTCKHRMTKEEIQRFLTALKKAQAVEFA